jgi:hypothetical protein
MLGIAFAQNEMAASPKTDPNAKGAYNAGGRDASDDPSPWLGYWPSPKINLHWEAPAAIHGLQGCLNRGWRNASPGSCSKDSDLRGSCFLDWRTRHVQR